MQNYSWLSKYQSETDQMRTVIAALLCVSAIPASANSVEHVRCIDGEYRLVIDKRPPSTQIYRHLFCENGKWVETFPGLEKRQEEQNVVMKT